MIVLDVSVAASWCFPDELHPKVGKALKLIEQGGGIVPELFWFELRNALLMGERRNRISADQMASGLQYIQKLAIEVSANPRDAVVLRLARSHALTFYDAVYLELAMRKALPLATLDKALIQAARSEEVFLVGESTEG